MSEIRPNPLSRSGIHLGNNRSGDWQSLRLIVYRTSPALLSVALITRSRAGTEALDGEIRGLQVAWAPASEVGDLRHYALVQALQAVTQTRR